MGVSLQFVVASATFLGWSLLSVVGAHLELESADILSQRRLQLSRHPNDLPSKNVDESNSYTAGQAFTPALDKPCGPDGSGYFGSTSGPQYVVRFGYGIEAMPRADERQVLMSVEKAVSDILISTYLPFLCQDDQMAESTGITGFRFDTERDPQIGTCNPLVHPSASCKVYGGVVEVHGKEEDILETITDHIGHENTRQIHEHILRLFPVPILDEEMDDRDTGISTSKESGSSGLTKGAISGIVISSMALAGGLLGFALLAGRRYTRVSTEMGTSSTTSYKPRDGERSAYGEFGEVEVESVEMEGGEILFVGESGRPTSMFRSEPKSEDSVFLIPLENSRPSSAFYSTQVTEEDYDL